MNRLFFSLFFRIQITPICIDGPKVEGGNIGLFEADQSAASVGHARMTIQITNANPRVKRVDTVKICDRPFGIVNSTRELNDHGRIVVQFKTHAVNIDHLQKISLIIIINFLHNSTIDFLEVKNFIGACNLIF